jgi:hypothetical protein
MTVVSMSSLTRIADLDRESYDVTQIDQDQWATGDYVAGKITGMPHHVYGIELASGRMVHALPGDWVIGAFGNRSATLEGVGSWSEIRDGRMQAMTSAGLFGAVTSMSQMIPASLDSSGEFAIPTILLVGTSMSAGKTTTGRLIVHELEKMGKTVIGTKLTGAGRYRDILSFRDAGADAIFDFVDAGLPSTVVPEKTFRNAVRPLLHHIDSLKPDFLVAEAGASPLEPYNGTAAIDELGSNIQCTVLCASDPYAVVGVEQGSNIQCTVLCASDPYAVVGVEQAFGLKPDMVSGPATSTSAAIDLVHKLSDATAINVMHPDCLPALRDVLRSTLSL